MALRFAISAGLAALLVVGAIWLGQGLLPRKPPPLIPGVTLDLVEPPESERLAAAELRAYLSVAPAKRFREAASARDLRPIGVGDAETGAETRAIPGTLGPLLSQERADLIERARGYARAYNLLVQRANSASAAASPERTAPSGVGASR